MEKKEKKVAPKKEKDGVEKYWQRLVKVYFDIYKENFKDKDGYSLEPNWKGPLIGMESKGLKGIIIRLRQLAEEKEFDWSEMYAVEQLTIFFKKALTTWMKKSFLCCQMNKFKDEIIVMPYNNPLVKQILELFYLLNQTYAVDYDKDRSAAEIIIGFLKAQYLRSNLEFTEKSVLQSVRTIFVFVKNDSFWNKKSLKSISNNLQEFVNNIKANKNGGSKNHNGNISGKSEPDIKPTNDFGQL